jgi:cell wall-associated NlpC family hydrolase
MQYGICPLSIVPLRAEPKNVSEQTSQLLYGEFFTITDHQKSWSKIQNESDRYEGWINNKHFLFIKKNVFQKLQDTKKRYAAELVDFIWKDDNILFPTPIGSLVSSAQILGHRFEGRELVENKSKSNIVSTALHYLNSPYMWGGKSPFGIDCSGLAQCVYQLHGIQLPRDAYLQARHGEILGFIDESEPGDLAFFDDHEGKITHVGMIMPEHHIIHAFGKVRIDRLDQTGIFNNSLNTHTHKLRVIKKIL